MKITKPGWFGYHVDDAGAYLQRWALSNRLFGDSTAIEGTVTLPGEDQSRLVISQPWIHGRDPTHAEIADYLMGKGFVPLEGNWVQPVLGVTVRDVYGEGNAKVSDDGTLHPIDWIAEPTGKADLRAVRSASALGGETTFSIKPEGSGEKSGALPQETQPTAGRGTLGVVPRPYEDAFEDALKGKLPPNAVLDLGHPGGLLQGAGVPDLPMRIRQRTVRKKTNKHDELTRDIAEKLPAALQAPMLVYSSPYDGKAHTIVTSIATIHGPITAYFTVRQDQSGAHVLDAKTMFGKDPAEILVEVRKAVAKGELFYKNEGAFEAWLASQARGTLSGTSHQHQQAIEGLRELFTQEE